MEGARRAHTPRKTMLLSASQQPPPPVITAPAQRAEEELESPVFQCRGTTGTDWRGYTYIYRYVQSSDALPDLGTRFRYEGEEYMVDAHRCGLQCYAWHARSTTCVAPDYVAAVATHQPAGSL